MKKFCYWFGVTFCAICLTLNLTMAFQPLPLIGTVFFVGFSMWWGFQLVCWLRDFKYLNK